LCWWRQRPPTAAAGHVFSLPTYFPSAGGDSDCAQPVMGTAKPHCAEEDVPTSNVAQSCSLSSGIRRLPELQNVADCSQLASHLCNSWCC
jgi:hypothetical protein